MLAIKTVPVATFGGSYNPVYACFQICFAVFKQMQQSDQSTAFLIAKSYFLSDYNQSLKFSIQRHETQMQELVVGVISHRAILETLLCF
jgi:hypothetical protein